MNNSASGSSGGEDKRVAVDDKDSFGPNSDQKIRTEPYWRRRRRSLGASNEVKVDPLAASRSKREQLVRQHLAAVPLEIRVPASTSAESKFRRSLDENRFRPTNEALRQDAQRRKSDSKAIDRRKLFQRRMSAPSLSQANLGASEDTNEDRLEKDRHAKPCEETVDLPSLSDLAGMLIPPKIVRKKEAGPKVQSVTPPRRRQEPRLLS